jgi:hypothetical protein
MNRFIAERITPHPVPLPMGEGTLLHARGLFKRAFSLWEKDRMRGNAAGPLAHRQVEAI